MIKNLGKALVGGAVSAAVLLTYGEFMAATRKPNSNFRSSQGAIQTRESQNPLLSNDYLMLQGVSEAPNKSYDGNIVRFITTNINKISQFAHFVDTHPFVTDNSDVEKLMIGRHPASKEKSSALSLATFNKAAPFVRGNCWTTSCAPSVFRR